MVKNTVIIGAQWGDEGKGKIVDMLTSSYDCVARFQGGHNAGHTLVVDGKKTVLHLIPSGILHPKMICVIAGGVVINLRALFNEIDQLVASGVDVESRLKISSCCPIILPTHKALDFANEQYLGKSAIGTTGRGIGPAYEDRVARRGLRIADLFHQDLPQQLSRLVEYHNFLLGQYYHVDTIDYQQVLDECLSARERLQPLCTDVPMYLSGLNQAGKSILFEGAQGALLDIEHGTYPYVTSSHTLAGGVVTSSGISMQSIGEIIGIAKVYTTRVGSGPFITECFDDAGQLIATRGHEFGSTTGRPRRCGWLDIPALRRTVILNGVTRWCLTKLDVLDTLAELQVCTGYQIDGQYHDVMPDNISHADHIIPVYERLEGWQTSTHGCTKAQELPAAAAAYLARIADWTGVPISMVSTGADRQHIIHLAQD